MQNSNALMSMAYVSENSGNPFAVFCEFIKYCIYTNNSECMKISEIKEAVSREFGLFLPHNVMLKCLSVLKNEETVTEENHQIKRIGKFDIEKFEQDRTAYREKERALVCELIKYVNKFDLNWSESFAREQLIKVLDGDGLAYDIFFEKEDLESISEAKGTITDIDSSNTCDENQFLFSDSFYVAKFLEELLKSSSVLLDYLKKVCEGLMISVGAYQLPSGGSQTSTTQIKGTTFYFDTRLLLRYVGCANDAAVQATRELVELIQSKGGIIAYFPHTLQEMENALTEAVNCSISRNYIKDYEMRIYAASVKFNSSVISAKKASLVKELENSNIVLRKLQTHSDADKLSFGFSYEDLLAYMQSKLDWDQRTIENDALSIWETHMCRQGVYRDYCGTKDRLCVFVTSNAKLIEMVLGYRKERSNTTNILGWCINRLPVITDVRLTCRLWDPSTQVERVSLLRLSANVVAAQRPTQLYVNKIKALATELHANVPEFSNICLSEYFDDEITNRIFQNTNGQEENLNITNFADTIEEFAEIKAKEQEERTKEIAGARDELKKQFETQVADIINGAVESNKNKMGISKFYLYLLLNWTIIVTFIFVGVSAAVSIVIGNWHWIFLILIPIVIYGVEYLISSKFLLKWMLKKVLPKVEKEFETKIIKRLKPAEKRYQETIIAHTKEKTSVLVRCQKILEQSSCEK